MKRYWTFFFLCSAVFSQDITGTGTSGKLAKFTANTAVGNAAASDVISLWSTGSCSGYLFSDTTCTNLTANTSIISTDSNGKLTPQTGCTVDGLGNFTCSGSQNSGARSGAPGGIHVRNAGGSDVTTLGATFTRYNGFATVSGGIPFQFALKDLANQTASITPTQWVTGVPGGLYKASCYIVVTAASNGSTLPACEVAFSDADSATAVVTGISGTTSGSTPGVHQAGSAVISVRASSTIQYQTSGYVAGASPLVYAVHLRLEYLGD